MSGNIKTLLPSKVGPITSAHGSADENQKCQTGYKKKWSFSELTAYLPHEETNTPEVSWEMD